jgi:hypothetical protein
MDCLVKFMLGKKMATNLPMQGFFLLWRKIYHLGATTCKKDFNQIFTFIFDMLQNSY